MTTTNIAETSLAGTGSLLRFMLRRDRIRALFWVLGIALMAFYVTHAVQTLVDDEEELVQLTTLFTDPIGRLMTGPAYGMESPTFERFFAAGYALFIYILAALMSIFTVVRHTRAEEQSGRAELLRANVLGRHAALTAALLLVLILNVITGVMLCTAALTAGFALQGSVVVALSSICVGLFFAGAAAVCAQFSGSSRGASAMAGGLLALSYLIRMGGDMAAAGGSTLSWFSPLGWSQQTAPYVWDRWEPLALLVGCSAVLLALGYWLSTQRDLGASLMAARLGPREAASSLGTPLGMAARNLRSGLRGWGIALILCAVMFGGYAQALVDAADELPEQLAALFSGDSMLLGYLAYMGVFMGIFVAAAGVSGLQSLRAEETKGRAEYALSAPLSRTRWLGSHVTMLLGGLLLILLLVGVGTGLGAAAVLEENPGQYFTDALLASVHQLPAVLAIIGVTTVLLGWYPQLAAPLAWAVIGYAAFMTNFGRLLDLPELLHELNIFGHLAQYPVQEIAWTPILVLSGIGILGIALGLLGWRRREINRV